MKITTKILRACIAFSIISGLSACSSSPSPWSSDDPWSAKRSAEGGGLSDADVLEAPILDPMLEPVMEEPMMMEPEPVMVDQDVATADPAGYAVQVYAGRTLSSVENFQNRYGLGDMRAVKTDRGGEIMYVLVSLHANRTEASQAAANVQQVIGSQPWVRSIAGLQKILAQ